MTVEVVKPRDGLRIDADLRKLGVDRSETAGGPFERVQPADQFVFARGAKHRGGQSSEMLLPDGQLLGFAFGRR